MSWTLTINQKKPQTIEEARERLAEVRAAADAVIRILTVEQAIRAQRVVREARRKRG